MTESKKFTGDEILTILAKLNGFAEDVCTNCNNYLAIKKDGGLPVEEALCLIVAYLSDKCILLYGDDGMEDWREADINGLGVIKYVKVSKTGRELIEGGFICTKTSGSTGNPKGIVFSRDVKRKRALQMGHILSLEDEDRLCLTSPVAHSLGQRQVMTALVRGITLCAPASYNSESVVRVIKTFRPRALLVVSLLLLNRMSQIEDFLAGCELILLSSSSSSSKLITRLKELDKKVLEMYGASEIGTATLIEYEGNSPEIGNVGKPLAQVEIDIGDNGVINVRTPLAFEGYVDNKLYTLYEHSKNLYHSTGDLGEFLNDGCLKLLGRDGLSFKVGGYSVNPIRIEVLCNNINIVEASFCCAVQDHQMGSVPAILIKIPVSNDTDLINLVKTELLKNLQPYELPRYILTTTSLPLLWNGKLNRISCERLLWSRLAEHQCQGEK